MIIQKFPLTLVTEMNLPHCAAHKLRVAHPVTGHFQTTLSHMIHFPTAVLHEY